LHDVTVRYGPIAALDDVDLAVEPGSMTVVVGGDGAGKTTLARALVGLAPLTGGWVGRPERVGFQPESSGVWGDLTVDENLRIVAGAYGLAATDERIDELLDVTALGPARGRLGRDLSGGMRQKLGVAMALLAEPELLVLDEPTTGLDPVSRMELWEFISRAAAEGRAVVATTTYVDEAERARRVLALDEGTVLAAGTIADVVAAMPGRVFAGDHDLGPLSWRRGREWRVWSPDGSSPDGAVPVEPDLSDVVTVASLGSGR
jgi:ABC-2 type transport system ATP-binding protein